MKKDELYTMIVIFTIPFAAMLALFLGITLITALGKYLGV